MNIICESKVVHDLFSTIRDELVKSSGDRESAPIGINEVNKLLLKGEVSVNLEHILGRIGITEYVNIIETSNVNAKEQYQIMINLMRGIYSVRIGMYGGNQKELYHG